MPNGQKKTAHAGRESIRYGVAFLILLVLLVIFLAMNVCIGTVNIPVAEIPKILSGHGADETFSDIVMGIRFPRWQQQSWEEHWLCLAICFRPFSTTRLPVHLLLEFLPEPSWW